MAWIDSEGTPLADPPHLFDPEFMSGAVLAGMLSNGDSDCYLDPSAPLRPIDQDIMLKLRAHAKGLADAS